jgi:hypothetical protein
MTRKGGRRKGKRRRRGNVTKEKRKRLRGRNQKKNLTNFATFQL